MNGFASLALKWIPHVIALFCSAIFLDSLRYKFTDHPKTQEIFSRLDGWAASLGAPGLFDRTGLFSQYTIGTAELIASALLLFMFSDAQDLPQRILSLLGGALVATGLFVLAALIEVALDIEENTRSTFRLQQLILESLEPGVDPSRGVETR